MENLRKNLEDITMIFISHNPQSKDNFEKIIELKNNKINVIK